MLKLIYYSYEVVYLTYHTTERSTVLLLNNLRNLVETKCKESTLLVSRSTDAASYLLNLNSCHIV